MVKSLYKTMSNYGIPHKGSKNHFSNAYTKFKYSVYVTLCFPKIPPFAPLKSSLIALSLNAYPSEMYKGTLKRSLNSLINIS